MGLKPLEFSDCLLDSPYFRDSIHDHEKELDETNESIKNLIKECRNLIKALECLSKAQQGFSSQLRKFKLRYIGEVDADDDLEYEDAFPSFAYIIEKIEEERDRMLTHAKAQLIDPLENFRREQIGRAKEEKKKFERETDKICNLVETHLKQSPKKKDNALMETDAQLEHELRNFRQTSLDYVSTLQEVNEKKKFEFVEILLSFMYGQGLFYHSSHEVFNDSKSYLTELQIKLQTTREHFDVTRQEAEDLKLKTKTKFKNGELHKGMHARQGYLFVSDKKRGVLGPAWVKHYCMYTKENKILTMIPYTQTHGKLNTNTDTFVVKSCTRKPTELSERRFLFEITGHDRAQPILLQSLSEEDRKQWLEVMDGREPIYQESSEYHSQNEGVTNVNETGLEFVEKCIQSIEQRGLDDQGLYRKAGVSSKFTKLLNTGLDPKQLEKLDLISPETTWEINTITSAMKQYFRNLSEPLLTFKHHSDFIQAIKQETEEKKIGRLKELISQLPENHYTILYILMHHLKKVAEHADKNLMQASNLGVVLGPTLMRPREETMAAIMGIKFQSIVIETMIKEFDELFASGPSPNNRIKKTSSNLSVQSNSSNVIPKSPKSIKSRAPEPPSRPANLPKYNSQNSATEAKPLLKRENDNAVKLNLNLTNNIKPPKTRPPATPPGPKPRLLNSSIKRWPNAVSKPSEPISPKKEPTDVSELKSRRESYAMAMDARIKSISSEPGSPSISEVPDQKPPPAPRQRTSDSSAPPIIQRRKEWKVRTKYHCVAESDAELSFNAGAIISNVRPSTEDGWLMGSLNGKTGLIPENYCEKLE